MKKIFDYLKNVERCTYYKATEKNVKPYMIEKSYEVIEILTVGEIIMDEKNMAPNIYGPGTIFWHQAGDWTIHKSASSVFYECFVIAFRVKDHSERLFPRISHWHSPLSMKLFTEDAINLFHSQKMDNYSFLIYLLGMLLRQIQVEFSQELPIQVEIAKKLIDKDLQWNFTTEELAKKCSISKTYLHMLFQSHLKTSPHQYQLTQRIIEARKLLAYQLDLSIKEIAMECGFDNIEVFYRQFKKHTGIPPSKYRKQQSFLLNV